jgi:lipoprotein-releasing system permease protein
MRLPWFIYLGARQLLTGGSGRGSVFFYLAVLGVGLGVCVLVVVQSVMGGFGQVHRERIIDTTGHLDITEGGFPFADGFRIAEQLRQMPEVVEATPYARGFVLARSGNVPVFPAVYGLPYGDRPVFNVGDYLTSGSLDELFDDTVLVSQSLAYQLRIGVGSRLELFSPTLIDQLDSDQFILPRTVEVAGIYQIDWNQDFIPGIVTTLRTMQDLYELGDAVHGIAVRLGDGTDEFAFARRLSAELPQGMYIQTWRERWADFLWVLDLEKTMMLFLNLFIVAVAVFAIAIAQLLTVVRKTREIGLLAVLGGRRSHVLGLYCFQGFFIGLIGTLLGIVLALSALSFRDPIIQLLATATGSAETLVRFYYFSNLPVDYNLSEILTIGCIAVGLSTIASLLPAWRAARLRPAETLRTEQ